MKSQHIINPVFLISLIGLILNDHYLKEAYHNWITGKLSDVFGIVVFVMFLSVFFTDKQRKWIFVLSALLFVWWKSPLSSVFINYWNSTSFLFQIQRTVDYTDLVCLLILIPLYRYQPKVILFPIQKEIIFYPLFSLTFFAITATSRVRNYADWGIETGNTLYVEEFLTLKIPPKEFYKKLKEDNITLLVCDSAYVFKNRTFECVTLENIYLAQDTIYSIKMGVLDKGKKTKIYIDVLTVSSSFGQKGVSYSAWAERYKISLFEFLEEYGD